MEINMNEIKILKYYSMLKQMQEDIYENEDKPTKNNIFKRIFYKFKNINLKTTPLTPVEYLKDDCIICFDTLSDKYMILSCGHKYHKCCIKKWIKEKINCPICRKILINKDYYKLTSKYKRIKDKIYNYICSFLEFIISMPLCLLVDGIIISFQLIKLGFEIVILGLNGIGIILCCTKLSYFKKFHKFFWNNCFKLFGVTRSYLTMFVCNQIRNYLEIRMSLPNTFQLYNCMINPPEIEEIESHEISINERFPEFLPTITLTNSEQDFIDQDFIDDDESRVSISYYV